jgi:hypothetical protein
MTLAIHRDGVDRLRAVYDHLVRRDWVVADRGLDHFARYLPEYLEDQRIAHHCLPQSHWLGGDRRIFSHIVPLGEIKSVPALVQQVIGSRAPELPHLHKTAKASCVSPFARKWLAAWTASDNLLGWNGKIGG